MLPTRSVVALISMLTIGFVCVPAQTYGGELTDEPLVVPVIPNSTPARAMEKPLWGSDVTISEGTVASYHKGQVVSVADTVGGIYVAINEVFQDTLSRIIVYRSTNGGEDWAQIGGFRVIGYAIQSFDMCIADTTGGRLLLGLAFTPRADNGSIGQEAKHGGTLFWGSMLTDGSHWRVRTIAAMTSSICYREPSICTNGAGAYVSGTRFFVAAVKVARADNQGWKLYVNTSNDWGDGWTNPDTTIAGVYIEYPTIAVDWTSSPDSLCIAFSSFEFPTTGYDGREICVARNTYLYPDAWVKKVTPSPTDDMYPTMAMDHSNGDIIVSYCRYNSDTGSRDLLYNYSTNQFRGYARDSIATTSGEESVSGIASYISESDHCWRAAYFTNAGNDTLYIRSMTNRLGSFHSGSRLAVNANRPELAVPPCIGSYRRSGGTSVGLYCVYVGRYLENVYFDASGLTVSSVIASEIPSSCTLMQNYPNPFNPTTTVGYAVSGLGSNWVRLAVYDLLGREVAVLLDERKSPGTYQVAFDGSKLSSGVYIYRLTAGNYVDSKRMILVK
jgi:hypothetical protein